MERCFEVSGGEPPTIFWQGIMYAVKLLISIVTALAVLSCGSGFCVLGSAVGGKQLFERTHLPNARLANKRIQIRGGQSLPSYTSSSVTSIENSVVGKMSILVASLVDPVIGGGLLSGSLHAITGPDHLAALIGPSIGKSWFGGVKIGALWGVGHGISAFTIGLTAFFLKGQFAGRFAAMKQLATAAESVVGLSILVIGLMGVREALSTEQHSMTVDPPQGLNKLGDFEASANPVFTTPTGWSEGQDGGSTTRAVFANGLLHGFSWDGAPSLAPAIAMASWRGAVAYLLAYTAGTMLTMSLAAGAVAELSARVGQASRDPDLPRKLSLASSVLAVAIGLYITARSTVLR